MIRFAVISLRRRRAMAASCVIALVSASLGFALVATAAARTRNALSSDLERTWKSPYDLLVRPSRSPSETEEDLGLVRPNFIGAIHGGITEVQLEAIRDVPGVTVAAPVAPVGFVEWPSAYEAKLPPANADQKTRLYRIRTTAAGDAGLSTFEVDERYVISANEGELDIASRVMSVGGQTVACRDEINCYAGAVCRSGECEPGGWPSVRDTRYYLPLLQPISIAGIDPVAENAMADLDRCITSGRPLTKQDVVVEQQSDEETFTTIPVLVADKTFVDQTLTVTVDEAIDPSDLSDPARTTNWRPGLSATLTINDLYRSFLPSLADYQDPWPIWQPGDVRYSSLGDRHLAAATTKVQDVFSMAPLSTEYDVPPSVVVPPEERDTAFRNVIAHPDQHGSSTAPGMNWRLWRVVGTYDPTCLPGFDPLAGGALETYSFPSVTLADGRSLAPNRSMAGYVNSPPLLLTSLDGARWMSDPAHFSGQPGAAFIGAVRVVGEPSAGPTEEAYEKLLHISAQIHARTGLLVDIVKGGSPVPVAVDLPAGEFGRPALTVSEGWTAKGVAVRLAGSVNWQDAAFGAVAAAILILMAALTFGVAIESRRSELVTLAALGWSPRSLSRALQAEFIALGLASSLIAGLCLMLVDLVAGPVSQLTYAVALLTPTLFGFGAGVAARSARARPDANDDDDEGSLRVRDRVNLPTPFLLAKLELRRGHPRMTLLAVLGVATGVGLTSATTLVAVAFGGAIEVSTLDRHIAFAVGPFHWLLGGLVSVATCIALTQIGGLAQRRRKQRLALLRALGWPRTYLVRLELWHAVILGAGSAVLPSVLVAVLGATLGQPVAAIMVGFGGVAAGVLGAVLSATPAIRSVLSDAIGETLRPTAWRDR